MGVGGSETSFPGGDLSTQTDLRAVASATRHLVAGRGRCGMERSVALPIAAALVLLAWSFGSAAAAERPDNVTLAIAGSFPAQIIDNGARVPGTSSQRVDARIEVRGGRVIYTTGDERFEMRFDGPVAVSTAPAECNGSLTDTPRRTSAQAWFAGGMMALTRHSEARFPAGGPCGGLTVGVNETFGIRVVDGRCEFGLTTVRRRSGARPLQRTAMIVPWRPCEATPAAPRQKPDVARVPTPVPPPAQPQAPVQALPASPANACRATPAGAIISKCWIVACPADLPDDVKARLIITEPDAARNLGHIDEELGTLQALMNDTRAAIATVERACGGGACDARSELEAATKKLSDLYYALQMAPEENVINDTAAAMARQYRQPDCMNQILQQTSDRLNVALDLMLRAEKLGAGPPR